MDIAAQQSAGARRPIIGRPKRTLGALALGLAALGVAVGSGADFTAETANPGSTFTAGVLSMDNSKDGTAIFQATNMVPGGEEKTGIVDIKNTGTVDGTFVLNRDSMSDNPPFASKVLITVTDCGEFTTVGGPSGPIPVPPACEDGDDEYVYDGTLAGEDAPAQLGTYNPGEQHRYRFGATLAASTDDDFEGHGASARFVFDAVQSH